MPSCRVPVPISSISGGICLIRVIGMCRDKKDDFDLEGHRQRMQLMDLERQREAGFFKSQGQNAVKVQ